MAHSKSVSWHVSSASLSSLDFDSSGAFTPTTDATSTSIMSSTRKRHAPSLSVSSDISYYSPANSPSKRHRSRVQQINPTPIVSPSKEHMHYHTFDLSAFEELASPSEEGRAMSPYIMSQPNLQDVFISLAHKERRVLEARESLKHAEDELGDFKMKWSEVLNIPSPSSASNSRSISESSQSNGSRQRSRSRSPPDHEELSPLSHRRVRTASLRGSLGKSGLGILIPEERTDELIGLNQEESYREVCERACDIDSELTTPSASLGLLGQLTFTIKETVKSLLSAISPFASSKTSDLQDRCPACSSSLTQTYYEAAIGVRFPRLPVVRRYIKSVC